MWKLIKYVNNIEVVIAFFADDESANLYKIKQNYGDDVLVAKV